MSAYHLIRSLGRAEEVVAFIETNKTHVKRQVCGIDVHPKSFFDATEHRAFLAIGMPDDRAEVAAEMPTETEFASFIHPLAFMLAEDTLTIGTGCIVYPQVYFSRNIVIGDHALIMPGTVIGHDVTIGDYLTSSANVSFGGGVSLGNRIFCGLGAAIRDHTRTCDDVFIAMSAAVTRDIEQPGTYLGNPAQKFTAHPKRLGTSSEAAKSSAASSKTQAQKKPDPIAQ